MSPWVLLVLILAGTAVATVGLAIAMRRAEELDERERKLVDEVRKRLGRK